MLCTFSAERDSIDPMTVYPYKRIPRDIVESVPEGFAMGRSDSGWMVSSTFYEYMANVLIPRIVEDNVKLPVLVFLDGYKSHINEELYKLYLDTKSLHIVYCQTRPTSFSPVMWPWSSHLKLPGKLLLGSKNKAQVCL